MLKLVTLHWCPVGCLAWKAARELYISCGWPQLAGLVCKRWRSPAGALLVPGSYCLDLAYLGTGEVQRVVPVPDQRVLAYLGTVTNQEELLGCALNG